MFVVDYRLTSSNREDIRTRPLLMYFFFHRRSLDDDEGTATAAMKSIITQLVILSYSENTSFSLPKAHLPGPWNTSGVYLSRFWIE